MLNRHIPRFKFTVDPLLRSPDGSYLNPHPTQFLELQVKLLAEYGIHPVDEISIRLVRGGDDVLSSLTYSEEKGWICTVGVRSGCSLSFLAYLEREVARRR